MRKLLLGQQVENYPPAHMTHSQLNSHPRHLELQCKKPQLLGRGCPEVGIVRFQVLIAIRMIVKHSSSSLSAVLVPDPRCVEELR